jgi:YbbR domain-containing protein
MPRRVHSFFTQNLPYKAVALFLSVVLWIVVERQSPRSAEERIDVQLVFRMDSSLVRVSPLPEVRARILVAAEELLRLETERPQIRRSFENDIDDSVVVTLRRGDVVLPEGVRARVLDVQPSSFVIRFDSLMQKTVPVRSALRVSAGEGILIAGAPRFEPDSVSIVGRRQTIVNILSVSTAAIDLIVSDTGATRVRLPAPAPGVEVLPGEVSVRVPIVRTMWP